MADFVAYPKVHDSVRAWDLSEAQTRRATNVPWVATEKIHGAHVCVCITEDGVQVAKRRQLLEADEDFFAHRRAIGRLLGSFRCLFEQVAPEHATRTLLVYGELFGGHYPHPNVPAVEGVYAVQTGVHYAPDVHFMAFDVAVAGPERPVAYLSYRDARALLESTAIPIVPALHVGSLNELLAAPTRFVTRVPAMLGLPPLDDNWAEGMVIRPYDASGDLGALRLKRKHSAFADAVYHRGRPWPTSGAENSLETLDRLVSGMLTQSRLDSAISKIGPAHNPGALLEIEREVLRDLRDTVEREHGAALLGLSRDDAELLWSATEDSVRQLLEDQLKATSCFNSERYFVDLVRAFIRGHLPEADASSDGALETAARAAELSLHKFKRKVGPPRVTAVLSILEGLIPARLLDIGSGRGAFLWPLLDRFPELQVTAIDRLPHRVRDIEAIRIGGIERLQGQLGDVTRLPFADSEFDAVTILEVLEHLKDPAAAAREAIRVAREFVVASVPSQPDDNPEHLRLFTAQSLTALFREAGAANVRISHVRGHMIAVVRSRQA